MGATRQHGLVPRTAAQSLRGALLSSTAAVPAPAGSPGRATAEQLGFADPGAKFVFYGIGDSGGIETPAAQAAVAYAMEQCSAQDKPAFLMHDGDVVYFGGDVGGWGTQFYEPYAKLGIPVLGWPGNHDDPRGGDPPIPDVSTVPPLQEWMRNMCSTSPAVPDADPQFEYGRHTQTQPHCDWTLTLDGLTAVGAWSNVPSGGSLTPGQLAWLTAELKAAPTDRPLMLCLHHPPLSIDSHHGGSQRVFDWLSQVFTNAGRIPALCLFGHVHDVQVFEWQVAGGQTLAVVSGNGGYHNLHPIASDYSPGMTVEPGVVCQYADASQYGFIVFTVMPSGIVGEYVGVKPGTMPNGSDATWTRQVHQFGSTE